MLLLPLAVVLIGVACTGGDDLGGEAIARLAAGDMVEVATGGGWVAVEPGDELPTGARVRTAESDAHVEFASGEFWLGPQGAAVIANDEVELLRGELLVASKGPVQARWTDMEVAGEGVYRITPGLAPRLGVYSGQVQVSRLAEMRTVSALREASLSSRRLAAAAQPLTYRADDRWDQFLLRDAIAFDGEAERLVRGLERQYGTEPRPQQFYAGFAHAPERTVQLLSRDVRGDGSLGPPGEALLRLFLAQSAAVLDDPEELEERVREVVELRTAGARWGLIASEFGITTQRLAAVVDAGQARFTALLDTPVVEPPPVAPDPEPGPELAGGSTPVPAAPQPPPADDPAQPAPLAPPDTTPAPTTPGTATPGTATPGTATPGTATPGTATPGPDPGTPDTAEGGGDPPQEPLPNPTSLLGQQPSGGLIEAVLDLLLGVV